MLKRKTEMEKVSIHAPAWGATFLAVEASKSNPSFNPRARMGRDIMKVILKTYKYSFNPRARMGRDPIMRQHMEYSSVSIHAPAWGATCLAS